SQQISDVAESMAMLQTDDRVVESYGREVALLAENPVAFDRWLTPPALSRCGLPLGRWLHRLRGACRILGSDRTVRASAIGDPAGQQFRTPDGLSCGISVAGVLLSATERQHQVVTSAVIRRRC